MSSMDAPPAFLDDLRLFEDAFDALMAAYDQEGDHMHAAFGFGSGRFSLRASKLLRAVVSEAPSVHGTPLVLCNLLGYVYLPGSKLLALSSLVEVVGRAPRFITHGHLVRVHEFAHNIVTSFLFPFLAEGGKTVATPTPTVTPDADPGASVKSRGSGMLKDLVCILGGREVRRREQFRCAFTNLVDMEYADQHETRNNKLAWLQEGRNGKDEDEDEDEDDIIDCQVAHIIPHNLAYDEHDDCHKTGNLSMSSKKYFWLFLSMFAPEIEAQLCHHNVDQPTNAFLCATAIHHCFGMFKIWLEEVPDSPNSYYVRRARKGPRIYLLSLIPSVVTFSTTDGIPPPDPNLLRLHAAIARVLEASGAGEYVGRAVQEHQRLIATAGCLAADGSSELTATWIARGLGVGWQLREGGGGGGGGSGMAAY